MSDPLLPHDEGTDMGGTYRKTEKNIGVDPLRIQTDLQQLLDNVSYSVQHETYSPDASNIRARSSVISHSTDTSLLTRSSK